MKRAYILRSVTVFIGLIIPVALLFSGDPWSPKGKASSSVVSTIWPRLRRQRTSITIPASRRRAVEYTLDDFIVAVDENTKIIRVVHSSNPDETIWKTREGDNFLRAAQGNAEVLERRGHFEVFDRIQLETNELTIDGIQPGDGSVTISGELRRQETLLWWDTEVSVNLRYEFTIATVPGLVSQLAFSISLLNPDGSPNISHNRIFLIYHTTSDEKFFGFGEQFTHLDMKGRALTIITTENGIGRNEPGLLDFVLDLVGVSGDFDYSYAPSPNYLTNLGHSLFLENYEISVFDLTDPNRVTIKLHGGNMRGRIIHGETPLDLIESYTEYSGRMEKLPNWLIDGGAVVGMQGGTDRVLEVLGQLRALDTPIAAFWLQDWVGKRTTFFGSQLWWNWILNEDQYPRWSENLIPELESDGIRVMTYVNPFLVDVDQSSDPEAENENDVYQGENLFKIARDAGYLVKNAEGEPYLLTATVESALLDLTNPEACEWMKGIIKDNVIDAANSSGWMADYGEGLPFDAVLASGESPETYHNKYPEAWARLNKEAIEEAGRTGDIVFFARSGFSKSPGLSTLFWEGDQMVTWDENDGLKSAVTGLLSSGLSGFSLNHNDIGGYTTVHIEFLIDIIDITRSRELLLRWMEMNAFTAVFRTHEGIQPEKNVQFYTDDGTLAHFSKFAKVHAALSFYRSTLMEDAAEKGYPIARHPFLHYPDDPITFELKYQWMLGSEFMVAPVTEQGQDTVRVYLPDGEWTHIWTLDEYEGGLWHTVDAPMGMPAVFFKKNSSIGSTFLANLGQLNVI